MKHKIVLASAGSGKTYSLSNRVLEIALNGESPERLIALTFTKKAAGEFSAAIFQKLAKAAFSQKDLDRLNQELESNYSPAQVNAVLEAFIEKLPKLNFGTLDSFFTKVVRSFSLELGLLDSNFQLLEGAEADELKAGVLGELLFREALSEKDRKRLLQAFKEANFGKEGVKVERLFLDFIDQFFPVYLDSLNQQGEVKFKTSQHRSWSSQKETFLAAWQDVRERLIEAEELTNKNILKAFKSFETALDDYVPGGVALKTNKFLDELLLIAKGESESVEFYKIKIQFEPGEVKLIEAILKTIALEEIKIKLLSSEALWKLLKKYNELYAQEVRSSGKLSFDDIKHFISEWGGVEESRLRREQIDYRLDAQYDHWLLDEFQDTSRAQWKGLSPLIQEVVSTQSEDRSLFIVGDEKQAIYGWRGGDYRLFKEISEHYNIDLFSMDRSWRSQKPVLDLVNIVLGNKRILKDLFRVEATEQWRWNDHFSAEGLPLKSSFSSVEQISKSKDKVEALVKQVERIQPLQRQLSCAVLVRTNDEVKTYANALREAGFETAEEGRVHPVKDNPVGLALLDFLKWLECPSDLFARRHLELTPLFSEKALEHADWQKWTERATLNGYTKVVAELFGTIQSLSEFGRSRLNVIYSEMKKREARGDSLTNLIDHLEKFQVNLADSPQVIQVMTIHQSKGLGYDVVFLPEVSPKSVEDLSRYKYHYESQEFYLTPVKWVSALFNDLSEKQEKWITAQTYESICLLYVAMTRAKRGLYIYLDEPSPSSKGSYKANWRDLFLKVLEEQGEEESFTLGDPSWYLENEIKVDYLTKKAPKLVEATKQKRKVRRQASSSLKLFIEDRSQQKRGIELHQRLSQVSWVDGEMDFAERFPEFTEAERSYFTSKAVLPFLMKNNGGDRCYREQKIEFSEGEDWYSVTIDRLNLRSDSSGQLTAEIIDFKLNYSLDQTPEKVQKVRDQLDVYRKAVCAIFPEVKTMQAYIFSIGAKKVLKF